MKTILPILIYVLSTCAVFGSGEALIRKQFVEYNIQNSLSDWAVGKHFESILEDGTWADIDYTSQRRGEWPTRAHLDRLNGMASRYVDPASSWYQNEALKAAVLNGLKHWVEKDYQNPNWYNGRIGVPYRLGSALVLLGDAVPEALLESARPILYRSELGLTGQNKVWCAGIGVMKGVLYEDRSLLERAVEDIWSELRVSTSEGIQPDWSFHQHGPQQQFGNYGLSFGDDMILWATVLRGTEYALSGDRLAILRNYLLQGPSWILWKGRMDFSGLGRHVDEGSQESKSRRLLRQLEGMKWIDPDFGSAYDSALEQVGFKAFWRSDMAVQRRSDWYGSVKMSSTRVVGAESCNSENVLGLHQGDGVLLTYVAGDEYEDIMPLWDWKRLPGTTCDQGFEQLQPKTLEEYGGTDFAGALGEGDSGVAAMIYKRNQLSAHKAWFFFEDHILCLGAGIDGETQGNVVTSVQQSRLKGKVEQTNDWVWHNSIGYQFLNGAPVVRKQTVEGNWSRVFPTRGDRPVIGEVFSLWLDHGQSPEDASYAYRIFPNAPLPLMKAEQSLIVSNSSAVQAVLCEERLYAVFYQAGELVIEGGQHIEVNGPCLLVIGAEQIWVSDPTHRLRSLEIKWGAETYQIELPQGDESGSCVGVRL